MKAMVINKNHFILHHGEIVDIKEIVNGVAWVRGMGQRARTYRDGLAMFDGKNFQIISTKYYYESFH
jgi:hypothetical protein